jgi:predicted transcriptional regulator
VNLSEQAVRYNLKKFEELAIVERPSEKIRDRNALYRFKSG